MVTPGVRVLVYAGLLTIWIAADVHGQDAEEDLNGLFPIVFNLASKADITVNATCGEKGPEVFCKLVEHVKLFTAQNRHCDICDNSSSNHLLRHPVRYAIDGSNRWWQSPTLTNGAEFNYVTITMDLKQIYQVAYVIIKAANAPRPGNWILEKSLDGVTYEPWQYFAMSDRECRDVYRKHATVGVPSSLGDNEVICTSRYSELNPLENGEIFVSLVNSRPGVFQPSKDLVDFVSARFVRFRFQKIRTLNADLMTFTSIDPKNVDETVTRRYFYSVKDISIGGHCICYGHATLCRRHETLPNRLQCHCEHNTEGDNCEKCLPLFNNKPWQVGGIQNLGCEECNCHGKADSCVYNATVDALGLSMNIKGLIDGGGVCINCKEYTTGINCEKCIEGYYRPASMTQDMRYPCRKCNCQETQAMTSQCVQDESRVEEGLKPGDCICQKGYAGRTCNQCETGYYGYPNCRPCHCNVAGSVNTESCDRACVCKNNVQGNRCDRCIDGHFNLELSNPAGCTRCYCFKVTDRCESVTWGLTKIEEQDGWTIQTLDPESIVSIPSVQHGWLSTHIFLSEVDPAIFSPEEISYWVAPSVYLGNRLSSYGGYLQFTLNYTIHNVKGFDHLNEPNFVLKGSNLTITSTKEQLRENIENIRRIRLHENSWFHFDTRKPVTREEMMLVLYNLEQLLIRAVYHTAQDCVSIRNVILDVASPRHTDSNPLKSVEQCQCPEGYLGTSCESCAPGYRRVNDRLIGGVCEKCRCHNHAATCDSVTGRCIGCRHNTEGDRCDRCSPGFIGEPRYGTPDDCKPCACPLVNGNNFFAERCEPRPTAADRFAYVCLNCNPGYTGERCEMCAAGYYGNPSVPGGSCRRCNCGGSSVDLQPGVCNNVTGKCYVCSNNTEGDYCERCKTGFYGVAASGDCRPCECHLLGSNQLQCHPTNGQCSCKERYTGRRCDRCQAGYGNVENGCERCSCDRQGSESLECDPVSGQCRCRPGVGGLTCNQCDNGYYDFSRSGCKRCRCHGPGTENNIDCDPYSGRCNCKPGVTGQNCERCEANHFGLSSGQGCLPCNCSTIGSSDSRCNDQTGQCTCKPGVGGRNCDRCMTGFYSFSSRGCQACEPCDKPGHICDQQTGQCVCPPYTEGPLCERCKVNCWGYTEEGCKPPEPKRNGNKRKPNGKKDKNGKNGKKDKNGKRVRKCRKPCKCSVEGSREQQCHPDTGQCDCLPGRLGFTCDTCALGYFDNMTQCQPCGCYQAGSLDSTCMTTYCECDGEGACFCKKNVEGPKCDKCRSGTFSPSIDNPDGCTECFCFGRSRDCRQAPYSYTNLEFPNFEVDYVTSEDLGEPLVISHGILTINSNHSNQIYIPPDKIDQPIFWKLPKTYPKDMTLSYNGKLKFLHYFDGPPFDNTVALQAPLVILIGNGIQLHTKSNTIEPKIPMAGEVQFNEYEWYLPEQDKHVSRQMLMVVLQNVQDILIRATQDGTAIEAMLQYMTLEIAVPQDPRTTSDLALGVELCRCPEKYSGESCQNPGPGYYREVPTPGSTNLENIDSIIGQAEPCPCNSHTNKCEPETGKCLDCQDNTEGDYCDVCVQGFYVFSTNPVTCRQCSCPLDVASNNFSPTCVTNRTGLVCTDCSEGYTGLRCERCLPGYYGNPRQVGDICQPCRCNLDGSVDKTCDSNGRCRCQRGISGAKCDECSDPTFGVLNGTCVSCYEGCTGILLEDLSKMTYSMPKCNVSLDGFQWDQLQGFKNQVAVLREKLSAAENIAIGKLDDMKADVDRYKKMADALLTRSNYTCLPESTGTGAEACRVKDSAAELYRNATDLEKEVDQTIRDNQKIVDDLRDLERLFFQQTGVNMTATLTKARNMLKEISRRNFTPADIAAKRENMLAEKLSESIGQFINTTGQGGADLEDRIKEVVRRLRDLAENTNKSYDVTSEAIEKTKALQDLLKKLKELLADINNLQKSANKIIDDAERLVEDADNILSISKNESDLLDTGIYDLESRVNQSRVTSDKLNPLVRKAIQHAENLQNQAENIDRLFAATRNLSLDAVSAANAYKNIIDAIREANKSADNALAAAKEAKEMSEVAELQDKKQKLISTNNDQKEDIRNIQSKIDDADRNLKVATGEVDDVEKAHARNVDDLDDINNQISSAPSDVKDRVQGIDAENKETENKINQALGLFKKFNATINSKLQDLIKIDFEGINKDIEVDAVLAGNVTKNIAALHNMSKTLDDKVNNLRKRADDMGYSLSQLRKNIEYARSTVNAMKMTLLADGQCVRSYRSQLKPSSANEISFAFKLNTSAADMLLVLLQQSPEEFIAAEIRDKKLRFAWNSGKGLVSIIHEGPLTLNTWYQVQAKRIGSIGELKVSNVQNISQQASKKSRDVQSAGCSLMNLNEKSTIFLAGSTNNFQLPSGITRGNFTGCLGDVYLDQRKLGVYNFKTDVKDHCGACKEVEEPNDKIISDGILVFNGNGFARLESAAAYSTTGVKMELEFKTFWENSRIFFVGNEKTGDFLNIELQNGRVAVHYVLGYKSFGSGQSAKTYNNNEWTKVIFQRRNRDAVLIVASETIPVPAVGTSTGLDIKVDALYFGGIPDSLKMDNFTGLNTTDSFFGCMRRLTFGNVQPDISNKSLLYDVVKSATCRENGIHTADFFGDGYLLLESNNLSFADANNDISLTFRTMRENGIILVASDISAENYYSISLVGGYLEARLSGKDSLQPLILRSTNKYNDLQMHCVSLVKGGGNIQLLVDDKKEGSGPLTNVDFKNAGNLYLGGQPRPVSYVSGTNANFDGCISDVIANGALLSMGDAKQYKRVKIGQCRYIDEEKPDFRPQESPLVNDAAPLPTSCVQDVPPDIEDDAKAVGDTASFFAHITKIDPSVLSQNFKFEFEFRTFYADGLFGYLSNADGSFYFGIQLLKGKLQVAYIHEGVKKSITFDAILNDGNWHSAHVSKTGRSLSIICDSKTAIGGEIDEVLDIALPIHMGGPRKINEFQKDNIDLVSHSIRGCIRSLSVNDFAINITDTQVIQDVGPCFKKVERGAYFGGTGYGALAFSFKPSLKISLEFKTTSQSGILVSTSDTKNFGLTLELHDGQVKFRLRLTDMFQANTNNTNPFLYCDNKWHKVAAELLNNELSLVVDKGPVIKQTVVGNLDKVVSSYLFVGGVKSQYKQVATISNDMLNGCLKDLAIDGALVDFYTFVEQHDVRKTGCPVL